jgi:hypothetical protein
MRPCVYRHGSRARTALPASIVNPAIANASPMSLYWKLAAERKSSTPSQEANAPTAPKRTAAAHAAVGLEGRIGAMDRHHSASSDLPSGYCVRD